MSKLDRDQIAFLKSHRIDIVDMFDGEGLTKKQRIAKMEAAGKRFYFGGEPCRAGDHTLRTKQGHCIQCDHSKIAYATRHSSPGCLYVAGSLSGRCVKVGSTGDAAARVIRLRSDNYGGSCDWEILAATSTIPNAGAIEESALRSLSAFRREGASTKGGKRQISYELLACNFGTAAQAVINALPEGYQLEPLCSSRVAKKYDWVVPS